MKRELSRKPDLFKHDIALYLDGVSFAHKHNPLQAAAGTKSRIWRKKNEGLQFTAKGRKDLAGEPRLHLIVANAYGKGVVLKEVYEKNGRTTFRAVYSDTFQYRLCAQWTKTARTGNGSLSWTVTPANEVR